MVVLCGDAGIGKSRLSQALTEHIGARRGDQAEPFVSCRNFQHSALYPLIPPAADPSRPRDYSAEAALTKLERSLAVTASRSLTSCPSSPRSFQFPFPHTTRPCT